MAFTKRCFLNMNKEYIRFPFVIFIRPSHYESRIVMAHIDVDLRSQLFEFKAKSTACTIALLLVIIEEKLTNILHFSK